MRIVKYRGSSHGTDEYPFLINKKGFSVLPLSSIRLDHKVSKDRISSGVKDLDAMLEGRGFSVDMLHYQSRPGLYVTANLYRPAAPKPGERLPAVLYVCGHSRRGRIVSRFKMRRNRPDLATGGRT